MDQWLRPQIPVNSTLLLRVLAPEDTTDYLQLIESCCDGLTAYIEGLANIATAEEALKNIQIKADMFEKRTSFSYGVFLSGQLVGLVGNGGYHCLHLNPEQAVALIYFLTPQYWGRGIAHQAVGAVIKELETRTNYRAVIAEIKPDNERSANLASRLGLEFTFELRRKNVYVKSLRGEVPPDLTELGL